MTLAKRALSAAAVIIAAFAVIALIGIQPSASAAVSGKTAVQITKEMGAGWNLGNTLDAVGNGLGAENCWGQPTTTKAMIDAVKAEGFNTVRIPVSWGTHTYGDNYTIDAAWLNRVNEVVDYCIDNDLYVILNIHHDNDKKYFYPSNEYKAQSIKYVKSIWTQLAARFKNYDQRLIFEILNEPRLTGTSDEWWFPVNNPNSNVSASIAVINEMNQAAVTAVRNGGGYNAERCIMISGYCASADGCTTPGFKLPSDTANNRLIVSVHAYTPYNFALNASGTSVFSDNLKSEVDRLFNTIKSHFTDKGIPVVIGETSASNKSNSAERIKWANYYFSKASSLSVPCVLWDNNVYTGSGNLGEQHGHLNRKTLQWYDKKFVDTVVGYYNKSAGKPAAPTAVKGFALGGRAGNALRLNWTRNTSADGYIIEQYKEGKWVRIARLTGNAATTYRVEGLAGGTAYKFRMKAYTVSGSAAAYSAYTSALAARTNPYKVSGLALGGRAADALRLNWTKNTSADGYIIEQYTNGKWVRIARIAGNATTTYRTEGLIASTEYEFRMKAYKMSGSTALYSGYTETLSATTNPYMVSGLKIGGRAADALRLNWSRNTSADGYIVEMYSGGEWVRISRITGNTTLTCRKSGLKANTVYEFRVRAYKIAGNTALYGKYTYVNGTTLK